MNDSVSVLADLNEYSPDISDRNGDTSVRKRGKNRPTFSSEGLRRFLVGLYPTKTAASVASDTGLTERTVRRAMAGDGVPSFDALARLIAAYGAPVLAASLDPCPDWIDQARLDAERTETERRIAALKAKLRRTE